MSVTNPASGRDDCDAHGSSGGAELGGSDGNLHEELLRASRHGDLREVKYLVEILRVDPKSCRDQQNNSPLHEASYCGHLNIVRYLVEEKNCDVECRNSDGNAPLHLAAYGGRVDIAYYLINDRGCDPMCRGSKGRTPLHGACIKSKLDVVRYLMEDVKVDPSCCQDEETGYPPLHSAAQYSSLDIVRYMVEEQQFDAEVRDKGGSTPLHQAALAGRLDILKYLISERGCDPMCKGKGGRNLLHSACQEGRLDVVKYLMEDVKANLLCPDDHTGATPLHIAAWYGTLDTVRYMVEEQKCDVECRDKNGDTLVHCAVVGDKLDTLQYLISKQGCNPMCRNRNGGTPLHFACAEGNLRATEYLIDEMKVDVFCRDESGLTPLHHAALNGHLPIVRLLVDDYLCDPAVVGESGQSPAACALSMRHYQIYFYLSTAEKVISSDLRRALVAELKPYIRKARATGTVLGSGTYGSVIELTSARETIAGKIFKTSSTARLPAIAKKVCGELILMAQLHHTNIVQCKGVCLLMDQPLPLLLMERLMSSLHAHLLNPANHELPLETKLSILHDTASGLVYLHSYTPAIIHRDLTAKNVLLDSELRAKITDFGNARIMDLDPEASPETFTSVPGTLQYMPPEAQGRSSNYDPSLDVFSFGHLSLFTTTQTPVLPLLPPTYSDSQGLHICSEVKRRQQFTEKAEHLLPKNHPLLALIKQCLHNYPAQRPRTAELRTGLQEMMIHDSQATPSVLGQEVWSISPRLVQLSVMRSPDGQRVEIIRSVAWKWKCVGAMLDFDARGDTLKGIQADEGRYGVESCCRSMFRHWLKGNGVQPATWGKLVEVLEDSDCGTLAADVKRALSPH